MLDVDHWFHTDLGVAGSDETDHPMLEPTILSDYGPPLTGDPVMYIHARPYFSFAIDPSTGEPIARCDINQTVAYPQTEACADYAPWIQASVSDIYRRHVQRKATDDHARTSAGLPPSPLAPSAIDGTLKTVEQNVVDEVHQMCLALSVPFKTSLIIDKPRRKGVPDGATVKDFMADPSLFRTAFADSEIPLRPTDVCARYSASIQGSYAASGRSWLDPARTHWPLVHCPKGTAQLPVSDVFYLRTSSADLPCGGNESVGSESSV